MTLCGIMGFVFKRTIAKKKSAGIRDPYFSGHTCTGVAYNIHECVYTLGKEAMSVHIQLKGEQFGGDIPECGSTPLAILI
jgi:hypothetical protein